MQTANRDVVEKRLARLAGDIHHVGLLGLDSSRSATGKKAGSPRFRRGIGVGRYAS